MLHGTDEQISQKNVVLLIERCTKNQLLTRAHTERLKQLSDEHLRRRAAMEVARLEVRHALAVYRRSAQTGLQLRDLRPGSVLRSVPAVALPASRPRTGPSRAALERLHAAYAERRDPALRRQLAEAYDPFARSLAVQLRSRRESPEDLIQVARIGLLLAIDRFDPALGRPFPVFARVTISGELKRHVRDKTWTVRVPRSLQENYLDVMRAVDELTAEHHGSPSITEVASRAGLPEEQVIEAMELGAAQRPLSLDLPGVDGEGLAIDPGVEDHGFSRLESSAFLAGLLERLPERERQIIELRFGEELSQSEIAVRVGVSQMCVSRLLARTLGRLRVWARASAA